MIAFEIFLGKIIKSLEIQFRWYCRYPILHIFRIFILKYSNPFFKITFTHLLEIPFLKIINNPYMILDIYLLILITQKITIQKISQTNRIISATSLLIALLKDMSTPCPICTITDFNNQKQWIIHNPMLFQKPTILDQNIQ